jgi:hypothetical protein
MQALKLQRKYPEFKQEEIMSLVNKFKCVDEPSLGYHFMGTTLTLQRLPFPQANRC